MEIISEIYSTLLTHYGPQGWWPYKPAAVTAGFTATGYHARNYCIPDWQGKFEIIVGAILTQNTNWGNVDKALDKMREANILSPQVISKMQTEELGEIIRASGYYNQKARKLRIIANYILKNKIHITEAAPSRNELLSIWGIGPETADSILLYAWNMPVFVVDAYTKRIFSRLGLIQAKASYNDVQHIFTGLEISKDYIWANEYHALIVKHAVTHCRKTPDCSGCPLAELCIFSTSE